jgi:hypothetical protein
MTYVCGVIYEYVSGSEIIVVYVIYECLYGR